MGNEHVVERANFAAESIGRALALEQAFERGGLDLAPCRKCGCPVACIPDGLPYCEGCAKEEDHA